MTRFIILALAVISTVYGADEFKYPTTGDACVLAKFDADFRLSITEGTETKDASWSLPAAASVDVVGSCGTISDPSTLTLTFNDSDTELLFTISESSGGEVSADLQYLLKDPSKIFPGINFTDPISLVGDGQEFADMGTANMSYRCVAPEFAQLTSNQTNVTAEANITFTNLQVQGFGVNASKFSDAFPCSMDNTSTTTQTPQTTTPMPPSGVGNYTLKTDNGTEVCLRLEANISITVHYSDKKGQMMNRTVMVPADAEVNGTCGSMETNLMLTFSDEAEMTKTATLEFIYTKEKGYAFISTVNVDIEFSDANETFSQSLKVEDVLALSENYYQCKDEVYPFDDGEVILQDLKEQVFNLKDGAFGKTGVECNAPPPKSPSAGNYSVQGSDNVTCISMDAAIGLKITYLTTENKNETVTLNFTKDEPAGGHCSEGNRTDESILIGFRRGKFSVEFIFVKDKASVSASLDADASPGFYVKDITVNYLLEQEYFPKVKDEGASVTAKLTDAKLFETASERYYKCSASSSVKINDNVDLVTQDLRIQAFNTDTKGPNLYGDNADECSADTDTNSIVPIAVGAALAGLVVIVLIAYLIGRRRNKKGYESV